jgi:hypothetical protein
MELRVERTSLIDDDSIPKFIEIKTELIRTKQTINELNFPLILSTPVFDNNIAE